MVMNMDKNMDRNSLLYWYPLIKDLNIPVPTTVWVEIPKDEWTAEWLDGGIPDTFKDELVKKAKEVDYPLFMRTDHFSAKHSYRETCYVESEEKLIPNLYRLIEASYCADILGLPINAICLREYIELDWRFHAFTGLPIAPERRYFIRDGEVICHHPYWVEEAVEVGMKYREDRQEWRRIIRELNRETPEEVKLLTGYARRIAEVVKGYWSIDFAKAKTGRWYLIDMAKGEDSWHPSTCPNLSDEQREVMQRYEGRKRQGDGLKLKDLFGEI